MKVSYSSNRILDSIYFIFLYFKYFILVAKIIVFRLMKSMSKMVVTIFIANVDNVH